MYTYYILSMVRTIINPLSGRKIQVGGSIHKQLVNDGILAQYGGKTNTLPNMRYNEQKGFVEVLDWRRATPTEEKEFFQYAMTFKKSAPFTLDSYSEE